MWDSAKKPMKIRSVIQLDGSRKFLLDDDKEDCSGKKVSLRLSKKKSSSCENLASTDTNFQQFGHSDLSNSKSCNSQDDFGINGYKVFQARKLNSQAFRRYSQIPEFDQIHKPGQLTRYRNHKSFAFDHFHDFRTIESLDLIPVKSPVIKRLINNCNNNVTRPAQFSPPKKSVRSQSTTNFEEISKLIVSGRSRNSRCVLSPETLLCSRIMTWIDLEVRKNGTILSESGIPVVGLTSGIHGAPQNSKQNGLKKGTVNKKKKKLGPKGGNNSSSSNSSRTGSRRSSISEIIVTSPNSEHSSSSRNNGSSSSSASSDIQLVSSLKKSGKNVAGKACEDIAKKKSVRISDDLPRWDGMRKKTMVLVNGKIHHCDEKNNGNGINNEESNTNSTSSSSRDDDFWGEMKIDDHTTVCIMGETKSRAACKIEVPSVTNSTYHGSSSEDSKTNRVQLHIFLPACD